MSNNTPSEITQSLLDISMIMSDAARFVEIRFVCEQWEKEAAQGNKDSATLMEVIQRFERLIKAI